MTATSPSLPPDGAPTPAPTPLPVLDDPTPPYEVAQVIAPGIRRIVARNPGPFTYTGTSTYLVGQGAVAVIDPGPDRPGHIARIQAALAPGERITHILVTHTHDDHSPAARPLAAATGARVYGYGPHGSGRHGGVDPSQAFEAADWAFEPDVRLDQGAAVDVGRRRLVAHHTPGHCSNHLCFADPSCGAVFTGDLVMSWSSSIVSPPDGDMAAYMQSLHKVKALSAKRLYPTHGVPIDEPQAFLDALIAHRKDREARVLAAVTAGAETLDALVPQVYRDVPPAMHPAAARSLLAHLIKLVDERRLVADPGPVADARFLPPDANR
ncbi:hypothetical protein CCR85_14370 [Rhodothalassium salexigens]|uniref:MBL fold metallo-hydrolase n=1 Tax=Rhodothalassium salexigens TaxID=1086 RepID=UPI0019114A92|nr:MBL fold metallo-hydrolase [Rhodothalassium salexigens]MBK5912666.1 hypothetical protein [Rhodothalassium salexigens]